MVLKSRLPAALRGGAVSWVVVALATVSGCGPSPQENVIHLACQALKAQDWEAFADLTVTEADYLMRENGIAENEADQSFAGTSMRPEQRRLLKEQFDRAVAGCDHCLDFGRCQFVFPTLNREATRTTLSGEEVALEEYALIIEMDGPERSVPGMGPYFVLARWENEFRIMGLRWPRDK